MYRLQLCRIDDFVVLKVVDSRIGDEVKIVAEHSASRRIAHSLHDFVVVRIKTGVEPHTLFQLRQSLLQFAEMRVLPRQQKEGRPAIGNLGQHIFDRENLSSYFLRLRRLGRTCRRTSRRSGRGRLSRNGPAAFVDKTLGGN